MKKEIYLIIFLGILMIFAQVDKGTWIDINEPYSSSIWCKGHSYNITWTKHGNPDDKVKIRLYNATCTVKILDIADNVDNDGSQPWLIPVSLAGGSYRVRVKTMDNKYYDDSDVFTVSECSSPEILVYYPNSTSKWCKTKQYSIKWGKNGSMDTKVKLRLFNTASTVKILDIADNVDNDGKEPWTIPAGVAPGFYRIRVRTMDNQVSDDSGIFEIKSCPGSETIKIDPGIWRDILAKIGPLVWSKTSECDECGTLFLGNLIGKLSLPARESLLIKLYFRGRSIAVLGKIGQNQMLPSKIKVKFSKPIQNAIKMGGGFELHLFNRAGKVLHTKPVMIKINKR